MTITTNSTGRDIAVSWAAIRRLRADIPSLTVTQAVAYLRQLAVEGRRRATPRHWMRHGDFKAGSLFVYSHFEPDYCLVMRDDLILQLVIRGDVLPQMVLRPGRPRPAIEPFDWRSLDLESTLAEAA